MLGLSALSCAIITFFMSGLHILLLIGMPLGEYVLGGKNKVIPKEKRYMNAIFGAIFLFLGLVYLGKADVISFGFLPMVSKGIMIIYTLFLGYAIVGNTFFTDSKKEKIVMIPASVIGFRCSLVTLIGTW